VTRRLLDKRYRLAALVASLCLLSLLLDGWQNAAQQKGRHTWLDGAVCAAASPMQGLFSVAVREGEKGYALLAARRRLAEENAALRGRVSELETRLTLLEEGAARARRREQLRLAFETGAPVAQVIGWGDDGWMSYLLLDRGSSQGVAPHDIAVARGGVAGQVYATTGDSARVLPLTDPSSQVAALLARSRARGILRGLSGERCELTYLSPRADVRVGDTVLTSGLGGVFPGGLLLGSVVSLRRETSGVSAEIRPAVELGTVEEVLLLRIGGKG